MSDTVSRGIRVQVESRFIPERSSLADEYYFFAYRVSITNEGEETAQLISREWLITDGEGRQQRVAGPGVVGEQPVLEPGGSFEYTSFCPLRTPVGSMQGHYQMVTPSSDSFTAEIAPFALVAPHAVN